MTVQEKIIKQLDENGIEYKLTEHEPVRTSEDAARVRGVDINTGAKAMVVKSKDTFYLLVLPAGQRINWRNVKTALGVKEVRFATEEEAEQVTGVKMGSVPPFGNIVGLPTYFDTSMHSIEEVNFNPGSRTHSIAMKTKDLIKLVQPSTVLLCEEKQP
ncbi:MAG: YbaK/EbsC family protein [Patescibacteria group bacterium]